MPSISSANSVFTLAVPSLFDVTTLQEWAADDAFDIEAATTAVTQMGVDGNFAWGYVPSATTMSLHFMASSASISLFEDWDAIEQQVLDKYPAQGHIQMPSTGKSWALVNGILQTVQRIPSAKRVLDPQPFTLVWGQVLKQPTT